MNSFNGRRFARWHLVLPCVALSLGACQPSGSIPTTVIDARADRTEVALEIRTGC